MRLPRLLNDMKTEKQLFTQLNKAELEAALHQVFIYHAIDNRGALASTRQADAVAAQIADVAWRFIQGEADETDVTAVAIDLGQRGLTVLTGAALMRTLGEMGLGGDTAVFLRLNTFQLLFLEKLAAARELEQQRIQERSQTALQRALHTQLEQQIDRHEAQTRYNHALNNILLLNAHLSQTDNEKSLIDAAVSGICQALDLSSVTLYTISETTQRWTIHTTTVDHPQPGEEIEPDTLSQLQTALRQDGEVVRFYQTEEGEDGLAVAVLLRGGGRLLGALVAHSSNVADVDREAYIILLRTFSQNLAALWRNLYLRQETEGRTHELEILYGRYIDQLWRTDQSALQARLQNNELHLERPSTISPISDEKDNLPLKIGDRVFGQIHLPGLEDLAADDRDYVRAIVREMGNALNNTRALQTAHAYSNQTSRLFETGRRISEAKDETDVYRALIAFAQDADLADMALILIADHADPDYLISPIIWDRADGLREAGNRFSRDKYTFSDQLTRNAPFLLENGQKDTRLDEATRHLFANFDYRAAALLPIAVENEWLGTLALIRREARPFTDEVLRPFQSLTNQASAILANQQLLRQTETLYQLGRSLTQTITRDDALGIAVGEVARYTGADQCRFVLYDMRSGKGIIAAETAGSSVSR
ncbi:MAG TPA: GAF domain-containing protein, partial [Anaerolineae bacterium]|nr:GAF domain-containing protein [Anaerolineae bacterium]